MLSYIKGLRRPWIKIGKTTKKMSVEEFRDLSPEFHIQYQNKFWVGKIQGWKLTSPYLRLVRYENGKCVEGGHFDYPWEVLMTHWIFDKGKIKID